MTAHRAEYLAVPYGEFDHPNGRQVIDHAAAQRIVDRLRQWNRDIVVDYQHETYLACARAHAAGWLQNGSARLTPQGVAAVIEWTPQAAAAIADGRYKFLSPVFEAQNGAIIALVSLGLTNNPNINSMPTLTLNPLSLETHMDEELFGKIKSALGLAAAADGDAVIAAVDALKTAAEQSRAALVDTLVNDAVAAGKITPAQRDWAVEMGKEKPESLAGFLANCRHPAPLGGVITTGGGPRKSRLTERQSALCRMLGVSEDDYLALS
ncbi:MAG: hypothetical protein HY804_00175 [Nitrospinae bacterium]|nr:hypothetical protein [Nitrospinota bacterium]